MFYDGPRLEFQGKFISCSSNENCEYINSFIQLSPVKISEWREVVVDCDGLVHQLTEIEED